MCTRLSAARVKTIAAFGEFSRIYVICGATCLVTHRLDSLNYVFILYLYQIFR